MSKRPRSTDYSKWVNKGCKEHGLRHKWRDDSSLCMHPKCLRGLIIRLCERSPGMFRRWVIIQGMQLDEDFIQHIAYYLLNEPNAKTLNSEVLLYAANRFTSCAYQPKVENHTNYTANFKKAVQLDNQQEMDRHEVLDTSIANMTRTSGPFVATLLSELFRHLKLPELILFATDQIDAIDAARLMSKDPEQILDTAQQLDRVKPWLAEWVKSYAAS